MKNENLHHALGFLYQPLGIKGRSASSSWEGVGLEDRDVAFEGLGGNDEGNDEVCGYCNSVDLWIVDNDIGSGMRGSSEGDVK